MTEPANLKLHQRVRISPADTDDPVANGLAGQAGVIQRYTRSAAGNVYLKIVLDNGFAAWLRRKDVQHDEGR